MKLILLPGFEQLNNVWTQDVKKGFNSNFSSIMVVNHITDMSKLVINGELDKEVDNLVESISDCEDCVIFAKTTGILVVLKAIAQGLINPIKCVFLQMPIIRARINDIPIDDWLAGFDIESLFIQRKDDPDFYFNEMSKYLKDKKVENYQLIELETLDYEFKEIEKYKNFVVDYLGS